MRFLLFITALFFSISACAEKISTGDLQQLFKQYQHISGKPELMKKHITAHVADDAEIKIRLTRNNAEPQDITMTKQDLINEARAVNYEKHAMTFDVKDIRMSPDSEQAKVDYEQHEDSTVNAEVPGSGTVRVHIVVDSKCTGLYEQGPAAKPILKKLACKSNVKSTPLF